MDPLRLPGCSVGVLDPLPEPIELMTGLRVPLMGLLALNPALLGVTSELAEPPKSLLTRL